MKFIKLILAALIVTAGTAHAQTWVTVANEGDTVVFNSSPVTVQFGAPAGTPVTVSGSVPCVTVGGCWDKPLTLSSGPPVTITADLAEFNGVDPAEGTVKVLQVLETASVQTVVVNGKPVIVPALPTPNTCPTPTAQWAQIAGSTPASSAAVPPGTIYSTVFPGVCQTGPANVSMITNDIFILETTATQIIPVTNSSGINYVQIPPAAASTGPVTPPFFTLLNLQFDILINNQTHHCSFISSGLQCL